MIIKHEKNCKFKAYLTFIIQQFKIWYWYHKYIEIDVYFRVHKTKDLQVCITKFKKIDNEYI